MKNNRYRRLRAREMADRDFCAGLMDQNPFPEGSMEAKVYAKAMAASIAFHREMVEMYTSYGAKLPTIRDPDDVYVRPALPGFP